MSLSGASRLGSEARRGLAFSTPIGAPFVVQQDVRRSRTCALQRRLYSGTPCLSLNICRQVVRSAVSGPSGDPEATSSENKEKVALKDSLNVSEPLSGGTGATSDDKGSATSGTLLKEGGFQMETDRTIAQADVDRSGLSSIRKGAATLLQGAERARERYQTASDAARELFESEYGAVRSADLSSNPLGSRSMVQDLFIPPAPSLLESSTNEIIDRLAAHVSSELGADAEDDVRRRLLLLRDTVRVSLLDYCEDSTCLFDNSRPPDDRMNKAVEKLFMILKLAGFHCDLPDQLSPPAVDAFNVRPKETDKFDASLMGTVGAHHPFITENRDIPLLFPKVLVAVRGTGLKRDTGLLLGPKLRSLEQYYLGWLSSPMMFASVVRKKIWRESELDVPNDYGSSSSIVRRVFPSAKLNGWNALTEFLLPVFTQEPTHRYVVVAYKDYKPNTVPDLGALKSELVEGASDVARRLVEPATYANAKLDTPEQSRVASVCSAAVEAQSPGSYGHFHLELFRDVCWGHLSHFLPPASSRLTLKTRDLFQIDLVTIAGLVTCLGTVLRPSASAPWLWLGLLGTASIYGIRIAVRLRRALLTSKGQISEERASLKCGSNSEAVRTLALLAAERQFATGAALMVASLVGPASPSPAQVLNFQESVFGVPLCSQVELAEWSARLSRWGLSGESSSDEKSSLGVEW